MAEHSEQREDVGLHIPESLYLRNLKPSAKMTKVRKAPMVQAPPRPLGPIVRLVSRPLPASNGQGDASSDRGDAPRLQGWPVGSPWSPGVRPGLGGTRG